MEKNGEESIHYPWQEMFETRFYAEIKRPLQVTLETRAADENRGALESALILRPLRDEAIAVPNRLLGRGTQSDRTQVATGGS